MSSGIRNDVLDDSRLNVASTTSSSSSTMEAKSYEQETANFPIGGQIVSGSKVISGASEILTLLRIFGEGCRLAYLYRCQVLINYHFLGKSIICIYLFIIIVYTKKEIMK